MKLEFISNNFDRPFGLPRYSLSLNNYLNKAGIEFSIVVPRTPYFLSRLIPLMSNLGFDLDTFFNNYPISAKLQKNSLKHFTNHTLAILFWFKHVDNTIVTAHDIDSDWQIFTTVYPNFKYKIYRLFERISLMGLKKADFIITDTVTVKNQIVAKLNYSPDRISVIPLGVDHDIFRPIENIEESMEYFDLSNEYRYVLHVGTDAPRKNILNLIRAFAKVKAHIPNIKLIKVGTITWPYQYQQIKELIHTLGLTEDIIFLKGITDQELANLYNIASVLVYPSFYEGFGLPVLEAMACGTPVITSETSCLPEVSGRNALLVNPKDVDGISTAICDLLTDSELSHDLMEKGVSHARQFTWEKTARQTIAVYEKVSGEKRL